MIGWQKVEECKDLNLLFLEGFEYSSNIYLLGSSSEFAIVDTGNDYTAFFELKEIADISELSQVFITHSHNDHSLGLFELLRAYKDFDDVEVYVHPMFKDGLERRIEAFDRNIKIIGVKDAEEINFGGETFKVLHTPGHTIDHVCLFNEDRGILFSGDAVVTHPIIDEMLGGSLKHYILTIRYLRKLEISAIFPGHGMYATENIDAILDKTYLNSICLLKPDASLKEVAKHSLLMGLVEEAEFVLEKQVEFEPDEESLKGLASIKADKGDYDAVIRLLGDYVEKGDFDALYISGVAALKSERFDEAVRLFRKALEIKEDRKVKMLLGAALFEAGMKEEAMKIEEFSKVVSAGKFKV